MQKHFLKNVILKFYFTNGLMKNNSIRTKIQKNKKSTNLMNFRIFHYELIYVLFIYISLTRDLNFKIFALHIYINYKLLGGGSLFIHLF